MAIGEVTRQVFKKDPNFFPIKPMDFGRFLVISIGTGGANAQEKYSAKKASKWGVFGWLLSDGGTPIIDAYSQSNADMVDFFNSVVFQALRSQDNYLRIQVSSSLYIHIYNFSVFLHVLLVMKRTTSHEYMA